MTLSLNLFVINQTWFGWTREADTAAFCFMLLFYVMLIYVILVTKPDALSYESFTFRRFMHVGQAGYSSYPIPETVH